MLGFQKTTGVKIDIEHSFHSSNGVQFLYNCDKGLKISLQIKLI